jgi:hypothetical protein
MFGGINEMQRMLKFNKSQLKHKPYEKLKGSVENPARIREPIKSKKLNSIQKKALFKKIKNSSNLHEQSHFKRLIIFTILGALLFSFIGYSLYIDWTNEWDTLNQIDVEEIQKRAKKQEKQFAFYLSDGETWLKQKHVHNAVYQFELAVKAKPNNSEAVLGLAKAYALACQIEKTHCKQLEHISAKLESLNAQYLNNLEAYRSQLNEQADTLN